MPFVVWVETIVAGHSVAVQRAAVVERQCLANVPTKLGLTLQEGRAILTGVEQDVVQSQVELQRCRENPGSFESAMRKPPPGLFQVPTPRRSQRRQEMRTMKPSRS
jgi:hypothetical protein